MGNHDSGHLCSAYAMVLYTLAFTFLIFALLGIKTLASVAVFASLYGICTGACK